MTFTATVTANSPGSGTPTGTVDFYDTTTNTDLTPGGVALSSGTATFSTTSLAAGSHTIKATYSGDTNFLTSSASTGSVTIGQSIIVLDPSAGGALSLSGNASIKLTGGVYVDSSSSTALSASGNAAIKASVIDVHGGVSKSGNASFSPAPVTGAAAVADPLASLAPAEHLGPDQLRLREPERQFVRDDQAGHLQPDHRLGQRHAHHEQRHLHHRRRRLLGLRQRERQRLGRDDLQRRQQLPEHGRHLRRHHAQRQRLVQPEPANHRDLRRDRDLPDARQLQGPHAQRQRLGHDRHDLCAGGPACRERQRGSSMRPSSSTR